MPRLDPARELRDRRDVGVGERICAGDCVGDERVGREGKVMSVAGVGVEVAPRDCAPAARTVHHVDGLRYAFAFLKDALRRACRGVERRT